MLKTILVLFCLISTCFAQCAWTGPKGEKYDFTPLTKNDGDYYLPRNDANKQPWEIWINICRGLVTQLCGSNIVACQQWDAQSPNGHASLGLSTSAIIGPPQVPGDDGYGATIQYTGGGANRKMEIDLVCDRKVNDRGQPQYKDENPQLHYNFVWRTKYACPEGKQGGGGGGSGKKGVSGGWLFIILLLVFIVVYLVAGILIKKYKMGATGIDVIPNVGFWTSLPGLVKDGFMFLINKARGRGGSYQQV